MKSSLRTAFLMLSLLFYWNPLQLSAQAEWRSNSNATVNDINTDVKRNGAIGIGTSANSTRKLNILLSASSSSAYGIYSEVQKPSGGAPRVRAVFGKITPGTGYTIGLEGYAYRSSALSSGRSYGVYSTAGNASDGYNYGVFSRLWGSQDGAAVVGYDGVNFGGWNEKVNGTFAGYFRGNVYTSNRLGIGTEEPNAPLDIRRESLSFMNLGSSLGHLEISYAHCNGCFSPRAKTADAVLRTLGQGKKLIFDTGSTFNQGESFLFTSHNETLLQIFDNGKVGIGTNSPQTELDVDGDITTDDITASGHIQGDKISAGTTISSGSLTVKPWLDIYPSGNTGWATQLRFMGSGGQPRHIITDDFNSGALLIDAGFAGNAPDKLWMMAQVQIGPNKIISGAHTNYSLAVSGKIVAKEAIVTLDNWADYVFEEDYELKPLEEVAQFIKNNKHLPDVPSAKTVLQDGISLGEMDSILLQKIEELTLYMLQLKEENETLKQLINQK